MEGGAELWRCHVSRTLSGDEVTVQSLSPSKNSQRKWQDGSCLGAEHFNSSEKEEALKPRFRNAVVSTEEQKCRRGGMRGASTWEPEEVKMIWCHFIWWDWEMDTFELHLKREVTLSHWRNSYRIRYKKGEKCLLLSWCTSLWKQLWNKTKVEESTALSFSTRTVVKWPKRQTSTQG